MADPNPGGATGAAASGGITREEWAARDRIKWQNIVGAAPEAIQYGNDGLPSSGGGWTPQQWAEWKTAVYNASGEEKQRLYESAPHIQAYKNSPQGQAPRGAASSFYEYGGDPHLAQQLAGGAFLRGGQVGGREAPQADFTASQRDLDAGRLGLMAGAARLGQAYALGDQQQGLANQYQDVISGRAGPSLAELSMQRAAGQEARRNLAMAAGAGSPGAIAALINAQNRNAVAQGELQQNLGIQRAAEVQQARGALGDVLTGMRGQTGAEAGQYGGLAGQAGQFGGITGQQALGNAALEAQQRVLNQQGEQYYYGQGADWIRGQAGLKAQEATNFNNFHLGQQSQFNQAQQASQARSDNLLAAGITGAGTALATAAIPFTGGATAPLAAAGAAKTADYASKASDIRAKTDIAPAGPQVSAAFAPLSPSSYFYRDPNAPGAEPGQHFGPMAHELERTHAGASVVRQMPDGTKGIDTGRLALLNASETGQLRRELDELKGKTGKDAKKVRATRVDYPEVRQPSYFYGP